MLDSALSLDPYSPEILLKRAALNMDRSDLSAARTDFERAQVYGLEQSDKTIFMVTDHQDVPAAVAQYRERIEREPGRPIHYFGLATALDQLQDCGAVPVYRGYVDLCDQGAICMEAAKRWSRLRWKMFADYAICSIDGHRLNPEVWLWSVSGK